MIEVRDLKKVYRLGFFRKRVNALQGATFDVKEGDLFGFIGPNGAGKSTSIKILLGLLRKDSGEATLLGHPAGTVISRREVGFLPEQPYFYDYLTAIEFLRFYGSLGGLHGKQLEKNIEESAHLCGLKSEWMDRKLRTFSKGMLQRTGLAQAILCSPRLVVLDEPMSGLDPMGRKEVRHLLQHLHGKGVTVFYSSHVLSDVEAICTRLAMMVQGTVRHCGKVNEVLGADGKAFAVTLGGAIPETTAISGCQWTSQHTVQCDHAEARDKLIQWAVQNRVQVELVEHRRPSLEDILTQEVLRTV
jgi:ABC-2 type transport system ATP-binding protein